MEGAKGSSSGRPRAVARLRLTKTGHARFMSHLDLIRTVERAIRRAGLPVALTEGFHPHPRMSFSPALPVGVESECEIVDVDLRASPGADDVARSLEGVLPPGIDLVSCVMLPPGGPAPDSVVRAASYEVDFRLDDIGGGPEAIEGAIRGLVQADTVLVSRVTPKGVRELNLRPLVYDLRLEPGDGVACVYMLVAAGRGGHARPHDVARAIAMRAGLPPEARPARIARKELYVERDGRLYPLS